MWIWLATLPVALAFGAGAVLGAPYLPILRKQSQSLLDLTELKPGQKLVDLGSGDGRLLKAAAKRGIYGEGYEINPFLHVAAVINCWQYRKYIRLHFGDYWRAPLPECDAIYLFLIDHFAARMARKLTREITRPTIVVSYVFELPGLKVIRRNHNAIVYHLPGKVSLASMNGRR